MPTRGDELRDDPDVARAKKLLLEAVAKHQSRLTAPRPADPALAISYKQLIDAFGKLRGNDLYYPYIGSGLGNGSLVELADGSVKYDFIAGIGPHFAGHSHRALIASGVDAAIEDIVIQGNLQQNQASVALAKQLVEASRFDHCFLSSSGAMANENAFKIAFQKRYPADRVIVFEKCFMGRTLAMAQATDKAANRQGLPEVLSVDYVPFFDADAPEASIERTLHALKTLIARYPGRHAFMSLELVQGEGGFNVGSKAFFQAVCKLLKEHDILIMVDEIQTFGRTPTLFAYDLFDLHDMIDICTIGKLSQVCATLYKTSVTPSSQLLSQTFTAATSAIYAALWIIETLQSGDYFGAAGKNQRIYEKFQKRIAALDPLRIKGPYGIGAMVAFQVFDGSHDKTIAFAKALYERGVIAFIAGQNPTRIRFLVPAIAVTDDDIDAVMDIVDKTLREV